MQARCRLSLESLEERCTPATYGVPWHDATHLTLSFVPDGTAIAGHQSTLFQTLNRQMPTATWQRLIAHAVQTWADYANISVGVVADGGQPFGAPGQMQGDPRFGDIRIGAQAMAASAISVSVPHDPFLSGTWSGDVLLNSTYDFSNGKTNLYSVMLHELGHVFGLDDNNDPNSVMYTNYNGSRSGLSSGDITAIQALYGVRTPDLNEGSNGNNSINTATQVPFPPGNFTGATPLVMYGDITTNKDVDYYAVRPLNGYTGPMTFRVRTAGISMLEPRLTVVDASGHVLGLAQSTNALGDEISVQLGNVNPQATYFVRVEGNTQDVCGIGRYGLGITFDANLTTTLSRLDAVLSGPYEMLPPQNVDALFVNSQTLFNVDNDTNDTLDTATQLRTTPGFASNRHYTAIGSLTASDPEDVYRIQAAQVQNGQPNVMTVTISALGENGVAPHVLVLDNHQNPLPVNILANGNGTYTVQAANVTSGANLFLNVSATPTPNLAGNYSMVVDFGQTVANLKTFSSGTLSSTQSAGANLYIAQNQLFQFVLSAGAVNAPADARVHMTITDQSGRIVFDLAANAGNTVSGSAVFLVPGAYTVRISAESPSGQPIAGLNYLLQGAGLSDPIGPVVGDPTLTQQYSNGDGTYTYPDGTVSTDPYYWLALTL
jgi:hypothetical protein